METVIIIGGGAAGMMAALTAAEGADRRVILLERQQRVGRKLLATGNGRCNLTNTGAALKNYHGEDPAFALPALEKFSPAAALKFFETLGLVTVEEAGGRVYPLSNSANSVLDILRFALEERGVELRTACPAMELKRSRAGGFEVILAEGRMHADRLILACGGAAGEKLGGVMDGYRLLEGLGHKRTRLYPSLVQLVTEAEYPRALKGVRVDGRIWLSRGKERLAESGGELQFTERGVSGPAAFDISRAAALCGEGCTVHMDFLGAYEQADVLKMLLLRRESFPGRPAGELFTGMLHNRLGKMLIKRSGIDAGAELCALTQEELCAAARLCKDFSLSLLGTEGFASAQVTAGGIKTSGFNPETLESWFVPGLFACGELLDIDGDCGGYNLQWAWASGRLAGRLGK